MKRVCSRPSAVAAPHLGGLSSASCLEGEPVQVAGHRCGGDSGTGMGSECHKVSTRGLYRPSRR